MHDENGKPVNMAGVNFAGTLRTVGATPVTCAVRKAEAAKGLFWVDYVPEHAAPSSLSIQLLGGEPCALALPVLRRPQPRWRAG